MLFSSSALIPQFLQALNHTLNPKKAEAVSFASPVEPAKPALSTTSQLLDQPGWSIGFYPKAHSKARSLISAKDLQHGDPKFLSLGAQVTIDRLYLPSKYPLQSLNVSIDYQPTELVQTIKVCAWSYCANGLNRSPATSLFVPVKAGKGLTLTMDWLVAGSLETGSIVHQLAVGSGQALPKLQRGYYVIAGRRQSTGDFPQWNTYHSIPHSEISDSSVLKHIDLRAKDASPIDFPYLLLSVDYGNSPTV
ncbi:hypothetical protein [Alkalinema sp. FACHB-956]|uniref:hypothetical protein n=1 Tax=Alkalinema sp. FACHB-956 TaxID=2692768 RepID=UPI0016831EB5|nr:hypothetical protein [Alkalinema sp. FACHB-956]MBD2326560.1 hypothetical protein [Alkalinema sp. FACHB-956]